MGQPNYQNGFQLTMHDHVLAAPLSWRKPQRIFVSSMSDLFHERVTTEFLSSVFDTMRTANWHQFLLLTKRSDRMLKYSGTTEWPRNVWAGVTVESTLRMDRLNDLKSVSAAVKFVSFEPLLLEIAQPDLSGISWIIVGGESGPGARPMNPTWARTLRDAAINQGVAFFFKQWGGVNKKKAGRLLDGKIWNELPAIG